MADPKVIPLPGWHRGINALDQSATEGQVADALNVHAVNGGLERRQALVPIGTAPPFVRPATATLVISEEADTTRLDWTGGRIPYLLNDFRYIYVGASTPFSGFLWAPTNDASTFITRLKELRVDYWNGSAWVSAWYFDNTRSAGLRDANEYVAPLVRSGVVGLKLSAMADWVANTVIQTGYFVRLSVIRVDTGAIDTIMEDAALTLLFPGIRVFDLPPVNGLFCGHVGNGEELVLVGGDRNPQRSSAVELGAALGVMTPRWTEEQLLVSDEGGGQFGQLAWPVFRYAPNDGSSHVPSTYTPLAAKASPNVGTNGRLTKGLQTYNWRTNQFNGAILRSDLYPIGTVALDIIAVQLESGDHDYEHCFLECTTSGGGATAGDRFLITDSLEQPGSQTHLIFYPPMGSAVGAGARFRIMAPPALCRINAYDDREWGIIANTAHDITFDNIPWWQTMPPAATVEAIWQIGQLLRWVMSGGRGWCFAVDPATKQALCSNGHKLLMHDGERLRLVTADDSSDAALFAAGLVREEEATGVSSLVLPKTALRHEPPDGEYMLVWNNRIVIAGLPSRPNDIAYSEGGRGYNNIWPVANQIVVRDSNNLPIRGLFSFAGVLHVFTPRSIHTVEEVQFGDRLVLRATQRVSGIGFVSHHGVAHIPTESGEAIVGMNTDGLYVMNALGTQPVPLIADWAQIGGVNKARLADSRSAVARTLGLAFFTYCPPGSDVPTRVLVYDFANGAFWPWSFPFGVTSLAIATTEDGEESLMFGCDDGYVRTMVDFGMDDGVHEIEGMVKTAPFRPFGDHEASPQGVMLTGQSGGPNQDLTVRLFANRDGVASAEATSPHHDFTTLPGEAEFAVAVWGPTDPDASQFSARRMLTRRYEPEALGARGHTIQVQIRGLWRFNIQAAELLATKEGLQGK